MDIIMNLQPHGWLDISITSSEGEIIEIPVSFLTDSIHELADKSSLRAIRPLVRQELEVNSERHFSSKEAYSAGHTRTI